jgi:uncharacterized oxidoreductase
MSDDVSGEYVILQSAILEDFAARLFIAAGVSPAEATVVSQSLVDANLCGHESHGVMRVIEYLDCLTRNELRADAPFEVLNKTASVLVCDAHFGFGQVQMRRLISELIPLAREHGMACGTLKHCGHVGRLGEWVEMLATQNLTGLMSVNDNGVLTCVAPPGGAEPRLSTNPIAIGVPTSAEPLVLDISTSVVANGKVTVSRLAGRDCPDGWLLDAQGKPTTDPHVRTQNPPGTIRPMGGYKGFGLGLLLDILVGGLSGGFCPPAPSGEPECNNVLLLVFAPEHFAGLQHFLGQSQDLTEFVRATRPVENGEPIRLPNDRSRELREARRLSGVPLDRGSWNELITAAHRLGVSIPVSTSRDTD